MPELRMSVHKLGKKHVLSVRKKSSTAIIIE